MLACGPRAVALRSIFLKVLRPVQRASSWIRRELTLLLLVLVYALVLPWFAIFLRVFQKPVTGWQRRGDGEVGTLPRLRRLF